MGNLKEQLKTRPPVADKWEEVKDIMSTHLWGKPPERLFRYRRPLESTNDFALEYRIDNFQPITKQPFNIAVSGIVETAGHIYVDIQNVDENTAEYVKETKIKVAGKTYNLEDYVVQYVTRMVEGDPNAVLIALPLHPTENLIPDYREDLPNFNTVQNEFVDIEIDLISSDMIHSVNDEELIFKGGEWLYAITDKEERYAPFYWMMTKEQTSLIIPYAVKNSYEYRVEPWYQNDLDSVPFDIIGDNSVLEEIDGEWISYHESHFSGAVAIGNTMLGVASDEQICTTRFVYPEKFASYEPCGHPGASIYAGTDIKWIGQHVIYDGDGDCSTCPSCNGLGSVKPDTSPLGTHIIAKSDLFTDDGAFIPPLQYITPPLESPEFLNKKVQEDYARMERALFIMNQNMTNQSGESKGYDVRQKVTVISGAVRNTYAILENVLNSIQGLLRGEEDIEITLPPDFQIKSSEDITQELGESRNTSSIYTSELTRELLLKKFGNTAMTRKMLDFLELQDLYFGMTADEILKASVNYPLAMKTRMQVIHDKGFAILKSLATDDNFINLTDEQLLELFNARIDVLVPINQESPIV